MLESARSSVNLSIQTLTDANPVEIKTCEEQLSMATINNGLISSNSNSELSPARILISNVSSTITIDETTIVETISDPHADNSNVVVVQFINNSIQHRSLDCSVIQVEHISNSTIELAKTQLAQI